jgi:predicted ArsR family transcriptional regulator
MFSIYKTTNQGKQTRAVLLRYIYPGETLTRDDLVQRSGLSYEQVRRQTGNLCLEGVLCSYLEDGKRVYRLRQSFIVPSVVST